MTPAQRIEQGGRWGRFSGLSSLILLCGTNAAAAARVAEWPVTGPILQAGTVSRQRDGQVIARPCRRIGQAPAVPTGPGQRLDARSRSLQRVFVALQIRNELVGEIYR